MPVTLRCRCQHTFEMSTAKWNRDGARCPVCGAIVLTRVKPQKTVLKETAPKETAHPIFARVEASARTVSRVQVEVHVEGRPVMLRDGVTTFIDDLTPAPKPQAATEE